MLQDAIWARDAWLKQPGNEDIATRFLRASFQGWMYCRDHPADCVQYTTDAGSTLGAGHQAWMMNEINPLVWPSAERHRRHAGRHLGPDRPVATDAELITEAPDASAYRTDLALAHSRASRGDTKGTSFTEGHSHGDRRRQVAAYFRQAVREAGPQGPASSFGCLVTLSDWRSHSG